MVTFVIGGMTGVLLAVPPVDFVLHNSAFLVAHFHNVIIGGVVFGALAGYNYWFPKAFGFTLDERLGKASFWCWLIGFYLAFMPLYVLGLMGMTRRLQHIADPSWRPLLLVAELGAIVIFCGILCQIAQLYVSIRTRESRRDLTGDPWNWPHPGMGDLFAAAGLQFCGAAQGRDDRRVLGHEAHRAAAGRAGLRSDRDAPQQPHGLRHGFLCGGHRLCADLAHLVDGDPRLPRRRGHVHGFGWSDDREREIPAAEIAQMERARSGLGQPA